MWSALISLCLFIIKIVIGFFILVFSGAALFRFTVEPFKGFCKCKTKLKGKVALITGGNSGIGFETAKDLAKRGARVIIASRNEEKSKEAVAIIKETTGNNDVEYRYLNLVQQDSIKEFAEKFNRDFNRLDILVNNAGCGAVKTKKNLQNGTDLLMQINYVGPFYLTQLLLDKLILSKPSRIVVVTSYAHNFVYNFKLEDLTKIWTNSGWIRYGNTKLCNILWTKELARQLPNGITVNSAHPGLVLTNIFDNLGWFYKSLAFIYVPLLFKSASEGAQTVIHLCVAPELQNCTGGYYADCKLVKSSKTSTNEVLAKQLWEKTVELINS